MEKVDPETGEVTVFTSPKMPPKIATAIVGVMKAVRQLGYDDKNTFQNYQYVSIDKFLGFFGPVMAEHGLILTMDEDEIDIRGGGVPEEGKKSTAWLKVRFRIVIVHESGVEWGPIFRTVMVPANGAQAFGSAQSYLIKQFLRGLFFVPTGDKDDPDAQDKAEIPAGRAGAARTEQVAPRKTEPAKAGSAEDRKFAEQTYYSLQQQIAQQADAKELDALIEANAKGIGFLKEKFPAQHKVIETAIAKRREMLSKPAEDAPAFEP